MKTILNFLLKSSADPRATSLTVKFALLGVIPYLMQALDVVCAVGYQCYLVDASLLSMAVDSIAEGVFYALSFASVVGTLYGAVRKLYRTATGKNLALIQ